MPVAYKGPELSNISFQVSGSTVQATAIFGSASNLHVHGTAFCDLCCSEGPFNISYANITVRANYTLASQGAVGTARLSADLGVQVVNASAVYISLQFEPAPQCALYNGVGGPLNRTAIVASPFSTLPEHFRPAPLAS